MNHPNEVTELEVYSGPNHTDDDALVVAAKNHVGYRMASLQEATNRAHRARNFTVETNLAGRAIELSWRLNCSLNNHQLLRGFRIEGGFVVNASNIEANGAYVVEARGNGSTVEALEPGRQYFYTFLLTEAATVYVRDTPFDILRSFLGFPTVQVQTRIVETLRFSVRMPSYQEFDNLDRMVEQIMQRPTPPPRLPPPETKQQKARRAIQDLEDFAAFEEELYRRQAALIEQLKQRRYPRRVRMEMTERLKLMTEALRATAWE